MTTTTKTTIQYSHTIGSLSNQGRGFQNPVDLALNSQGLIYVLNRAGPEIPLRLPYKRISICTLRPAIPGRIRHRRHRPRPILVALRPNLRPPTTAST